MDRPESLSHSTWECKYHVVFIPKCRRRVLYEELRLHLGEVFHNLARQKESEIEEGHLLLDHVHMLIAIPPKYAVSTVGRDEAMIRAYIRRQEEEDRRLDQLQFWPDEPPSGGTR